ncbi:glucokinase [Algoriphagus alkaliphilus]|uniref:Glucokinase n=2 Tax=Algoriphagus TaxID=246875 RepID=A0A1G5XWN8_9BACT|nr:ROK family protein [Algoriphagus alkaliphilus]MBA4299138.1 ROK family protein [Cyclobacterium sp.]SDA74356.1 glucokinase [Algoriphagus alkaliphilus]
MSKQDSLFLGVDVGGTHLKIGLVDREGNMLDFQKEDTTPYRDHPDGFGKCFIEGLGKYLKKYPEVEKVGIGLPGMISKDRTTPLEIPAIPNLNGFPLKSGLLKKYPKHEFYMENDAAAAAIGEFYYGKGDVAENFLFITMGTGIGSALILEGQVFKGSRGNALEMGHMLSRGNAGLETLVGRNGILRIMDNLISAYPEKAGELIGKELGTHLLVDTAKTGNEVSLMVFKEVAQILSESIVSTVRILDVTDVYFGGGISAGLEFMMPTIEYNTRKFLTPYYVKDLKLKKATLENNAGTLGAAALCFMGSGL